MFDGVLNATMSKGQVSTTVVTQGNLEIPLPPISVDSHQTKKWMTRCSTPTPEF